MVIKSIMITELNRFDKTNKCEQMKIKLASYVVVLFTILGYVHKQKLSLEPKTKHCFLPRVVSGAVNTF
jgi:hypothetical protein